MVHLLTLGEEMTIAINGGCETSVGGSSPYMPNVSWNLID
jgi:hypothetical protein